MKKLIYSLVFVIATVSANAGGGGTISSLLEKTINATLRTKSPDVTCDYQSGSQTIRLFRNGVAATCPTKACPTPGLAGTFNYDEYHFKNTSSFPICLTVNFTTGACGTNVHSMVYLGDFNPALLTNTDCGPGFLGDIGSSTTQPYSVEIPACTDFSIVNNNTASASTCSYSFRLTSATANAQVACAGTECIKTLTLGGSPVPTMTQWGLFLFGLIVLTLGVVAVFNMSRRSSNETAR
ncbi:MAG: hypothetical protein WAS56_01080 [Saprospiraceae bacterium]|nr:hypothetical protein [Saprospiraceae bacterium]MBK7465326.1 hypothetical protein [Saprospiraceae bacterium]